MIGTKLTAGTRVRDSAGRFGSIMQWLPNEGAVGGYAVAWDDGTSSTLATRFLDLAAGAVTEAEFSAAAARVDATLGIVTERAEASWGKSKDKGVGGVLIVARPTYLPAGQELHAHVGPGGGMRKAHIKSGETYVRSIYENGGKSASLTAQDEGWLAAFRTRNSMRTQKQQYMDRKLDLP